MPLSAQTPIPAGDPAHVEPGLSQRPGLLFYHSYGTQPWTDGWGMEWGPTTASHGALIQDPAAPGGRALRVSYPQGQIGGDSGLQYFCRFSRMGLPPLQQAYLRYYLRFAPDFDFVKGGKLPGLAGGKGNTGGHVPNGKDGWSARIMWRPGGRIVQYLYHPGQKTEWGDDLAWNLGGYDRYFVPGQWMCVETFVRLNTPGQADGEIRSWLDGEPALQAKGLRFRDTPDLNIDVFYFSTFFGGGDLSWAATKPEHADFAAFAIGEGPLGPAVR